MRLESVENAESACISFEEYSSTANRFHVVIFVASLHHMDLEFCLKKAKELLVPGGQLLIVGCAKPDGLADLSMECLRVVPAKIGSWLHGEKKIGVPVQQPDLSLRQIRNVTDIYLPGAKVRRGLYYRYLLSWVK